MKQTDRRKNRVSRLFVGVTALGVTLLATAIVSLDASGPRRQLGLDLYRPVPDDNTLTIAKIVLGRQLFHERRLSRDGSLSCSGCHDPKRAFTDGRRVARGVADARGTRNVPIIVNRAWGRSFFWDGRAPTLEEQVLQPILNPDELAMTPERVVAVALSPRYRREFEQAFGALNERVVLEQVARAIASYVRTIQDGDAPYDRYLAGDRSAISRSAQHGLELFRTKAGCTACHVGPTLSDERFHNTGVAWRTGALTDEGRAKVTHAAADRGAFKTPTLREVARTAPYMHDGSFATLAEVVDFYDRGNAPNPGLDSELHPLHLTPSEKRDLIAFLQSLNGRIRDGE
jgi:cytochrome c peroxidase